MPCDSKKSMRLGYGYDDLAAAVSMASGMIELCSRLAAEAGSTAPHLINLPFPHQILLLILVLVSKLSLYQNGVLF